MCSFKIQTIRSSQSDVVFALVKINVLFAYLWRINLAEHIEIPSIGISFYHVVFPDIVYRQRTTGSDK